MNVEEKLQALLGKATKKMIGGVELDIHPLELGNIDLLMKLNKEEQMAEAMKEIVIITLRKALPGVGDDQLNKIALNNFTELTEVILEVNGLKKKK